MNLSHIVEQAAESVGCDPSRAWTIADLFRREVIADPSIAIRVTNGPRKAWDGTPDLSSEGWMELHWERFDYHEEITWIKPVRSVDGA